MLVSAVKEIDLTPELIDRLLFRGLEDSGENADCILVLGSMKAAKYRMPVAVEAYKVGRAKKILLCGGKRREFPDGMRTEAEDMYRVALKLGVTQENLILENSSMNTVENILFAMIALQRTLWLNRVNRVLLVTTAYHMRRSLAIARYLFPAHITVLPCPANDTSTRRDNWMDTPIGTQRARNEAWKLVSYVTDGVIPDFEV